MGSQDGLQTARTTLDAIKADAESEEAADFDPSGTSNRVELTGQENSPGRARSWNGDSLSRTDETDPSSLSDSIATLGINSNEQGYDKGIDAMCGEEKQSLLIQMFPDIKPFDIKFTLDKCKQDFGKVVGELLNQQFLNAEYNTDGEKHDLPKGVDGFADDTNPRRKGRGKKRKKIALARRSSSTPATGGDRGPSTPTLNRWEQAKEDIEFITQRSHLSAQAVMSIYNKADHSLRATIHAICDSDLAENPYAIISDPIIQAHTIDLASKCPEISPSHLAALVLLAHPSTASARELAEALVSSSHPSQLIPQYLPTTTDSSPPYSPSRPSGLAPNHIQPSALNYARSNALAQASAAYRKSKSHPLMGGAASHYASVAREAAASLRNIQSRSADALVAGQSTTMQCDLHGVVVRDAVRIASEYVSAWWGSRAEYAREGKVMGGGGFKVVVGRGTHSDGGRGRLGPAVSKALRAEGWRIDEGQGVLVIKGRVRK